MHFVPIFTLKNFTQFSLLFHIYALILMLWVNNISYIQHKTELFCIVTTINMENVEKRNFDIKFCPTSGYVHKATNFKTLLSLKGISATYTKSTCVSFLNLLFSRICVYHCYIKFSHVDIKFTVCQLYSVYISLFYNNKKIITIYEREIPNKV